MEVIIGIKPAPGGNEFNFKKVGSIPFGSIPWEPINIINNIKTLFIFSEELDPKVQNCVDCYTSDWVVMTRKYQQYSSSVTIR